MELQKATTKGNGTGTSHGLAVNPRNIETVIDTITPAKAKQYLELNDHNRRLREKHIEWLADQMRAGEWALNGESIKFVGNQLVDGQHRLWAVIKSNTAIQSLVVRFPTSKGRSVFKTVDTGQMRGTADVLDLAGEANTVILSSMIRMLYRLETNPNHSLDGISNKLTKLSHQRILTLLNERYPDARASATFATTHKKTASAMLTPVVLGVAHYLFSQINESDATSFFTHMIGGANLSPRNPVLVLRNKLTTMRAGAGRQGGAIYNRVLLGMTIKAWNFYREGKSCSHLRMAASEEMPKPI